MKYEGKIEILGNLNSKIQIIRNSHISDGCGGFTEGYIVLKECRASIRPMRAREVYIATQNQQETSHNIIIRYFDGLKNSDIIKYKDKEFDISTIINVDNNSEFYELLCKERGN